MVRSLTGSEIELDDAPGGPGGIVVSGPDKGRAFKLAAFGDGELVDGRSGDIERRALGPALLWADKLSADNLASTQVELIASEEFAGDLARRAAAFSGGPKIWRIDGTNLTEAVAVAHPDLPSLGDDVMAYADTFNSAGARPVDDHGRLVAEVAGLEVARVVRDGDGQATLEVGVGQADRELHFYVHSQLSPQEAVARAVAVVAEHRNSHAPPHPLNRMARERWLRALVLDDPTLLGLSSATALAPLRPRATVLGMVPVAALGQRSDGTSVLAVFSVGVDVDVIPEAADYRLRTPEAEEVMVVIPARDHLGFVDRLAARTSLMSVVDIEEPWVL